MNRRTRPQAAQTPLNNAALSKLLEEGARNLSNDRVALLQEIQQSQLLIPVLEPAGPTNPGSTQNVKMAILEIGNGRALAGFTDIHSYRRFAPVQHLTEVTIAAVELCRFACQGRFESVVINPGGPYGYQMSQAEYQMIAEGLLPGLDGGLLVAPNTQAQIGMPAQRPTDDTLNAMREIAQQAGAQEVYWFWLAIAGGLSHMALAVLPADPQLIHALGNAITPLWKEARPDNPLLDILPFADDEISQVIRTHGERLL